VSTPLAGREVHLASRPVGRPTLDNFAVVTVKVPEPADGEVLVRNQYLSVDPYMRGRMNDVKSYVPPFRVGEVMDGGAVGVVVDSRAPALAAGDVVVHNFGWREYVAASADRFRKADTRLAPAPAYLGVLGTPGFTAYVGLSDIAAVREGDVVFVSGAAGAVGSIAGQIAKLSGASRVIGSAGSDTKTAYLRDELGFDAAFNYKTGDVRRLLAGAAPEGIDVYFDNVGGDHLEAAIGAARNFARIAACGAISQYNATEPVHGPRNMPLVVSKRLTIRGFIIIDHADRYRQFATDMAGWVPAGKIRFRETVVDGLENAPAAFIAMLDGENIGKMLVRTPDGG
jgi:NADPH-dependent curcumin reductase CurA